MKWRNVGGVIFMVTATGCRAGGCVANVLGDVVGYTGDSKCDRRFVGDGGTASGFCQEIVDTVATGEFESDCRDKHLASTGEGLCPREHILAGCKLSKVNDDGSEVWDWYYDVSELEADGAVISDKPAMTKDDVRALCEDRKRYEEGATFNEPP